MATLNKVMLIGRLTADPEPPRTLPNTGNRVVSFRFAVGRSRKNPQTGQWENDPNPLFIDCEAFTRDNFTRIVDLISNSCRKGMQLYVEGQLRFDMWDDKQSGQKRSKHKIVVEDIQFLDGPRDSQTRGGDGGSSGYGASNGASDSGYGGRHDEPPRQGGNDENIPF